MNATLKPSDHLGLLGNHCMGFFNNDLTEAAIGIHAIELL